MLNQPKLRVATDDAELFQIIKRGIEGSEMPGFWTLTDEEIRRVAGYVRSFGRIKQAKLGGDTTRGKALYETKGNCAACHIVRGQGGVSGPELTEIGARRSPAYLREALLDPNKTMPEGFLLVSLITAEGARVRGVRINEDTFSIQLRDGDNRFQSFRKETLKELRREFDVSSMPVYRGTFTTAELDDLIAYLASLRGRK